MIISDPPNSPPYNNRLNVSPVKGTVHPGVGFGDGFGVGVGGFVGGGVGFSL